LKGEEQMIIRPLRGSGPADHCLVTEMDGRVVGAVWTRIMKMMRMLKNSSWYVNWKNPEWGI